MLLVPLPPDAIESLLAGRRGAAERTVGLEFPADFPAARDEHFLKVQLQRIREALEEREWGARLMVLKTTPAMIGRIGFHGAPAIIGRAELGYTVYQPWRRQGFATEGVQAMVSWAAAQGCASVYVSIAPDNQASLALAKRFSLRQVGVQEDEFDGTELVYELKLSSTDGNSPSKFVTPHVAGRQLIAGFPGFGCSKQ
jgi:RimJ/RimL family protein N-acetyltransferase